jgi:hypothetical protein
MLTNNNRLETIATRQTTSRVRTLVFAACLALTGLVSVATVGAAATSSHELARR